MNMIPAQTTELLRVQKMHNGEKVVPTFSPAEMTRRQTALRTKLA